MCHLINSYFLSTGFISFVAISFKEKNNITFSLISSCFLISNSKVLDIVNKENLTHVFLLYFSGKILFCSIYFSVVALFSLEVRMFSCLWKQLFFPAAPLKVDCLFNGS